MSSKPQGHYDEDFKQSCARLAFDSEQPICKIAAELGIKASTLYVWVKKYHPKETSKQVPAQEDLYAENIRLRKELKRVTEEREILKKAAAYFAQQSE